MRPAGTRLPSLTGLRFFAALSVFFFHARDASAGYGALGHVAAYGNQAVTFFFVLSGFVLLWSRRPDDDARAFWQRRWARIGPDHLASWVLAMVVILAVERSHQGPLGAVTSLALVQSWVPREGIYFTANSVEWTLSCEVFFYALFPVIAVWVLGLTPHSRRGAILAVLVASVAIDAVLGPLYDQHGGRPASIDVIAWLQAAAPPVRLLEFVAGVLMAAEVLDRRRAPVPIAVAWAALAAGVGAEVALGVSDTVRSFVLVPSMLLVAAYAVRDASGGTRWLGRRRIVVLGEWSFAFYLLHQLVQRTVLALGWAPADRAAFAGWIAVTLAASLAASAALFTLVERPAERRLRGVRRRRVELATELP